MIYRTNTAEVRIEALAKHHNRADFSCGIAPLDLYLHRQVGQEARRGVTAPFVLIEGSSNRIAGYYTLSAMSIALGDIPDEVARRLPRYPMVPATLLGRLAVDQGRRGRGFGETLLVDALRRSWRLSKQIGSVAVVVDAKDEHARTFYEHFGFMRLPAQDNRLFLLMSTIEKLLS